MIAQKDGNGGGLLNDCVGYSNDRAVTMDVTERVISLNDLIVAAASEMTIFD